MLIRIDLFDKISLKNFIRTKSDFHAYDFFDILFLIIFGSFEWSPFFARLCDFTLNLFRFVYVLKTERSQLSDSEARGT